jgi:basic amino acid/polyamine antiporter, APA family
VRQTLRGDAPLLRQVGFWGLAASIVNMTIGGAIFVLPGVLASSVGSGAPLVFVLGALVFIPIALCFSAAGSRISASGGLYRYVRSAFGPLCGFLIGAMFWISNAAASGGMAAALLDQMALVWPMLAHPLPRALTILSAFSVLYALNARGIRVGAVAGIVLATIKLLPLFLLVALGCFHLHGANLHAPAHFDWSAVGGAMVIVVFAYSGLENALSPSGEISDPSKVVPLATLTAIATVVALYVGLQIVAQGALGGALPDHPAPLAALTEVIVPGAYDVLLVVAGISMFGTLQGDLVGSSRLIYALARDGYLPLALSKVSVTHRVPTLALAAHAAVVSLLTILGSFRGLALMAGGAFCLVYLGCCAAAWQLQRLDIREHGTPFVLWGGATIPLLACSTMILILATLARAEWQAIGLAVAFVMLLAGVARWRRAIGESAEESTL